MSKRQRVASPGAAPCDAPPLANDYAGWRPSRGAQLDRVACASLSPREFFERYVATRTPCITTGGLGDAAWRAPAAWTDEHLRSAAGTARVRVETREHAGAAFGAGSHASMRFDAFLAQLTAAGGGDALLYLTTEATRLDAHGRLAVVGPPLTHLLDDVPLRPALAGALIPAAVNLWLGRAAAGASSGLHHDWHDNLYALLRGRKRFALYAPSETLRMYPRGVPVRVHANGRINYFGAPSRADGADARDVARVAALEAADAQAALAAAEVAERDGAPGGRKARRAAEAALEEALAETLRAEALAAGGACGESGDEDGDDSGSDGAAGWCGQDDYQDSDAECGSAGDGDDDDGEPPPHFSTVDASRLQDFPLFAEATCVHADVAAGELLFLPAGWWHEVTSWSDGSAGSDTHLAVNWWFHPPDTADFDKPYSSTLWARDNAFWERDILPTLAQDTTPP